MKEKRKTYQKRTPLILSVFFESLSVLLDAGLPIHRCLELMAQDAQSEAEKTFLEHLNQTLEQKHYLYEVLEEENFPAYAASMVKIVEFSGTLQQVCETLSSHYAQEHQRRIQLKSTVLSPFILICVMAVVIAFLVMAILPVFANVYAQIGIDVAENGLINAALLIGQIAMWVILIAVILAIAAFLYSLSSAGKQFFHRLWENSFFTRKLSYRFAVAQFTSSLSMMLNSGMDITTAMELTLDVCQNRALEQKLKLAVQTIQEGNSLGNALYEANIYSPLHAGMLKSSVQSGTMPRTLEKLSSLYQEESAASLDAFLSVIEPVLTGIMSFITGIILVCIMLPLVGILSTM